MDKCDKVSALNLNKLQLLSTLLQANYEELNEVNWLLQVIQVMGVNRRLNDCTMYKKNEQINNGLETEMKVKGLEMHHYSWLKLASLRL